MRVAGHELNELRDLAETTATVAAACEAGVFAALRDGPAAPHELADRADLDERAVAILLPVLAEAGVLEPVAAGVLEPGAAADGVRAAGAGGSRFALTEEARRKLADPDSPDFEAGGLPLWLDGLRAFTRLPEVLRTGEPVERPGPQDEAEREDAEREGLKKFMAGMAAAPEARVGRIVDACLERAPGARTVLDLGGGPGHMARAFVERGLRATLLDRPETVDFVADAYGLSEVEDLELVGGDFIEDPLPDGPFDIVLMSNIVHIYSPAENRALLAKVAGVTASGGVVGIADFFRGRSGRAVRFAMVMLLKTEGGNTYTEDELASWLESAGFRGAETVQVDDDRHLILAVRRSAEYYPSRRRGTPLSGRRE
ncbi:MAG: class I SAM-dependent methyltransferase [Gemmatimonadota bacterium]